MNVMEELALDEMKEDPCRTKTSMPVTSSIHAPRCIQAPGVPTEEHISAQLAREDGRASVWAVSLANQKCMRRQEDWLPCHE